MVACVTHPKVSNFIAAEAFREFLVFRRHYKLPAPRAGRPTEITFVKISHGHNKLESHGEPLRARIGTCWRFSVSSLRPLLQEIVKKFQCIFMSVCIFGNAT